MRTLTFCFNYNTIHVTTAAFSSSGKMQVAFVQFLAFILNEVIHKRKRKSLKPMEKKKRKKKAVEGLSQKSLTGSFKHIKCALDQALSAA